MRILMAVVLLLVAAGGTLLVAGGRQQGDGAGEQPRAAANGIWQVGTSWTVKVPKDNVVVAPNADHATTYLANYKFEVIDRDAASWTVRVLLDEAQGPFADGFRLVYRESGGAMHLTKVGIGKEQLVGAEHATITLGADFPLERRYTSTPRSRTLKTVPGSAPGALPPDLPAGGAPPGDAPPAAAGAPAAPGG